MSMSKKLYAVILLLIVVAIVITGIGFYGLGSMEQHMTSLSQVSKLTNNLKDIDSLILDRKICLENIVISTDDTVIQDYKNKMKETESRFSKELEDLKNNIGSDASPNLKTIPDRAKSLWDDFVMITDEIAFTASINSYVKAPLMAAELDSTFIKISDDIAKLAAQVQNSIGDNMVSKGLNLWKINSDIDYFHYNLTRFVNTQNDKEIKDFGAILSGLQNSIISEISASIAALGQSTTFAQDLSTISNNITNGIFNKLDEIIKTTQINSNTRAMEKYNGIGEDKYKALSDYIGQQVDEIVKNQNIAVMQATSLSNQINMIMIISSVVALLFGLVTSWRIISGLTSNISYIVSNLGDSSTQVNSTSGQISTSSQNLAEGATTLASSLEETSATMEEMASMTKKNADNANITNEMTKNTNNLIGTGSNAVSKMLQAMAEINDSAKQIGHIIKTIEDIAFQTNLLALNAAVEAARAGDAGQGFAVVADEVRNLAGRSAQAARDTTQLIQTTVDRVRNGTEIANLLDSSFRKIEEGSNSVAMLINEISSATNEQAQGVDQINIAIAQMDQVTQKTAATAEETATASEELATQATNLSNMFKMLEGLLYGSSSYNLNDGSGMLQLQHLPSSGVAAHPKQAHKGDVKMIPLSDHDF